MALASIAIGFCSSLYSIEHQDVHRMPLALLEQCDEAGVCQVLNRELANFPIRTCAILMSGWDNTVAEINGEWIFRFPRQKDMAVTVARESALLEKLHNRISMPIPQYEFFGTNVAMVGYRKLQGEAFFGPIYRALSADTQQAIAESLALFMAQMHGALSVAEARELGYDAYNPPLDTIEQQLLGTLPSPALEQLVSEALASAREHKPDPARLALIYNDLHGENMAYDPVTQKIAGIFDFSDAIIADFAIEFSKLFLIDADLAERAAAAYSKLTGANNILGIAATDHIIRRATYVLAFRDEGNSAKEAEMLGMLTAFVPVWMKIMNPPPAIQLDSSSVGPNN